MASWIRFRSRFVAALLVFALTSITVMGCATNGSESSPSSPGTDAGYDSAAKAPEQSSNDVQQRTYILMEPIRSGLGHLRAHFLLHGKSQMSWCTGHRRRRLLRSANHPLRRNTPQRANRMRRDRSQCIPSAYHTQSHWNPFRHYWIKIVQTFGAKHVIPPASPYTCLGPVN